MKLFDKFKGEPSRIAWRILSVPVFIKILGIGAIVAIVFGSVTVYFTEQGMSDRMNLLLNRRASALARYLAADMESSMDAGDVFSVSQKLKFTRQEYSDVVYIVVRDFEGEVIAHTFENGVPSYIADRMPHGAEPSENTRTLDTGDVQVFDVVEAIPGDRGGRVQIGLSNEMVQDEMAALKGLVLGSLVISVAIGISMAVLLTHILTKPIYHLKEVAERIREGSFGSRARVYSEDEIGALAVTINHMAESLEDYRREVQEKEKARASLLAKIVQAQEDERKHIALELHDQLGQGLSKTLVTFQGIRKSCECPEIRCGELEEEIRGHIDDVRQLAWDMRPAVLDDYGLDSALERYLRDIQERTQMEVDYQKIIPEDSDRLPIEVEVTIYRIAQEAMTNVIRHANADKVCVTLLREDSQLSLVIEDNGSGFDVSSHTGSGASSLGLMGMKERATLIGAEVEIESKPGQGTEVLVTVPLSKVDYAD